MVVKFYMRILDGFRQPSKLIDYHSSVKEGHGNKGGRRSNQKLMFRVPGKVKHSILTTSAYVGTRFSCRKRKKMKKVMWRRNKQGKMEKEKTAKFKSR